MSLKASLTMYAWPEVRHALDQFWRALQQQLVSSGYELPAALNHNESGALWLDNNLALSQTCSFPLNHQLGINWAAPLQC